MPGLHATRVHRTELCALESTTFIAVAMLEDFAGRRARLVDEVLHLVAILLAQHLLFLLFLSIDLAMAIAQSRHTSQL